MIVKIFNFIKIFIFKYKYLNKLYSYLSFLNVYITNKHLILYFENFLIIKNINFFDYSEDKFKNIKNKGKININKSISINVPHWVWLWKNKSRTFSDFNIKILNNEKLEYIEKMIFALLKIIELRKF